MKKDIDLKGDIFLKVDKANACKRLDVFITDSLTGISRSTVQKMVSDKKVSVNGNIREKRYALCENDMVVVKYYSEKKADILPKDIDLDIVFEDEHIVVVNKPKGMVVHPGAGNEQDTLVNALLHRYGHECLSNVNDDVNRPGIVHRLDKDTSGLLIVAKNNEAHLEIARQIKNREIYKEYAAVIHGKLCTSKYFIAGLSGKDPMYKSAVASDGLPDRMTINAPIGRHKVNRKTMCVDVESGRNAVTHLSVVEEFEKYSYVRVRLETGRTHQIRVHMSHINRPIAGDTIYGIKNPIKKEMLLCGQCLHSKKVGFSHPKLGVYIELESDLPEYFTDFLKYCRD